uniref:Uncharacterized protein n=1 Tax=uncultured prokaryote TaxID=198431 RepID=A0A0H5QCZ7_9ZZZZ|nr:hypothetical protein [uncultured prokaryote]
MSEEDKTDSKSIRIERFIDDGEGLIITYPPEHDTHSEDQD